MRPMFDFTSSDGIGFFKRRIKDTQLIQISWILPTASVILASLIHYLSGNYRDIPFFISETDHPGLEDHVFSIGLFLSSITQVVVSFRLYLLFKPIASPKLHIFALFCGLATSTHLAVLAFVTMDQNLKFTYTLPWWSFMAVLRGLLQPISHCLNPPLRGEKFDSIPYCSPLYRLLS